MKPFDLRVMASLLRQGRRLHGVSMGLAALAAAWLVLQTVVPTADALVLVLLAASLLAAASQLYCAIRVDFDADLLASLSAGNEKDPAQALDASLHALGLRPAGDARGWNERWHGARGWMLRQAALLALQGLLLVAAWLAAT